MKSLVVVAHPSLGEKSVANRVVVERVRPIAGVTVKDLHRESPGFAFDVAAEQRALLAADAVVFQFPLYWYAVPGILKEWMDQVLTYGFAYGSTGDKLKGKRFVASVTVGGPADSYREGGYNHFTIEQLLLPLRAMTNLTGMRHDPPIVSHGMIWIPGVYNTREEVEARAREHGERLAAYLAG